MTRSSLFRLRLPLLFAVRFLRSASAAGSLGVGTLNGGGYPPGRRILRSCARPGCAGEPGAAPEARRATPAARQPGQGGASRAPPVPGVLAPRGNRGLRVGAPRGRAAQAPDRACWTGHSAPAPAGPARVRARKMHAPLWVDGAPRSQGGTFPAAAIRGRRARRPDEHPGGVFPLAALAPGGSGASRAVNGVHERRPIRPYGAPRDRLR